jgi:phage-related protein
MEVEFIKTSSGKFIVKDFLKSIDMKAHKKILRNLELLLEGPKAFFKYSQLMEKMDGYKNYKLYEFKTVYNNIQYRILCCLHNATLYLVHGFIKKTRKIATAEINIAIERIKLYILTSKSI